MNLKKILAWTLSVLAIWVSFVGSASAGYYTQGGDTNQLGTVTSANAGDYHTIAGGLLWNSIDANGTGSLANIAVGATKAAADTLWTFVTAIIPLIGLLLAAGLIWFIIMAIVRKAKSYMQAKGATSIAPSSK